MRHIDDAERRARLAVRHAIAPGHRVGDALAATRAMAVLHATEPATVHLSVHARVDGVSMADVDRALYDDRSLVKQLAMRRTLFVFPRDLLPAAWGSASARVAGQLASRLVKDIEASGLAADGAAWLDRARREVVGCLGQHGGRTAAELRAALPLLGGEIERSPGTRWGGRFPVLPQVVTQLGVEGSIVRGPNTTHWRVSRPRWTSMEAWLDERVEPLPAHEGYAELVRRWLGSFGPGTEADLAWWLGATKSAVRRALADVAAVRVGLDGGATGWVLADDLDEVPPVPPWAALLPVLDPTTMGWKERDFYLDPGYAPYLFDSNGNGGTTAWWNGRIVGCWVQDDDGRVRVVLHEDVGAAG